MVALDRRLRDARGDFARPQGDGRCRNLHGVRLFAEDVDNAADGGDDVAGMVGSFHFCDCRGEEEWN